MTKEDGRGKWWEGLDPQELYNGRNIVMPDGITTIAAANAWHNANDRVWNEHAPAQNPDFTAKWFLRCQDLVDKYHPDVIYFDNTGLPLEQAGLDIAAHYYNASLKWNGGKMNVVINTKQVSAAQRAALVEDIERGVANEIRPAPWQTDTCIGSWHYQRSIFERHQYKTVKQVTQMLVDIVSKNGNLMLSVPIRGDGTLDTDELAFLEGMAKWIAVNGDGIYSTRPWKIYGEGPSVSGPVRAGQFGGARDVRPYTAEDIRFTTKGDALYAFMMVWPETRGTVIKSLAINSPQIAGHKVAQVSLLGHRGGLAWTQDEQGLNVKLPAKPPGEHAVTLKIKGVLPA